jgi:hypothetical protein
MGIFDEVLARPILKNGIWEHHIKHTPVTVEEWNSLWARIAVQADRTQEDIQTVVNALLGHAEGTVLSTDEDRPGRHGLRADANGVLQYWTGSAWRNISIGWQEGVPLLNEEIFDLDFVINDGAYAADAAAVRRIYVILADAVERVENLEARTTNLEGDVTNLQSVVNNLVQTSLTEGQHDWMEWMSAFIIVVGTEQPAQEFLDRWPGMTVIWVDTTA